LCSDVVSPKEVMILVEDMVGCNKSLQSKVHSLQSEVQSLQHDNVLLQRENKDLREKLSVYEAK